MKAAVVRISAEEFQGSGFIIDPDGLILTANHVVENVSSVTVELGDASKVEGTVVGRHLGGDVALVSVSRSGLPTIPLGDSDALQPGDTVIKIGHALGLTGDPTAASGIVSAFRVDDRFKVTYIQTDASLNPGDSGGPLLNRYGEVVGINTAKFVGTVIEGVGYAVSINDVKEDVPKMAGGNTVCQPLPPVLEGQKFRHSIYGYTVPLPSGSGWTFYQNDDGTVIFGQVEGVISASKDFFVSAGVFIYAAGARGDYPSLDAYLQDLLSGFKESFPGFELLSKRPVCVPTFGVTEAFEVEATVPRGRTEYRERWLLFFMGARGYLLEGFAWPEKWESQQKYIDTMLYGLRFE